MPVLGLLETGVLEESIAQPLLVSFEQEQHDDDGEEECDVSEESLEQTQKPVTSIVSAYRLLTPSVKVWIQLTVSPKLML